jgi:hypothetical protein
VDFVRESRVILFSNLQKKSLSVVNLLIQGVTPNAQNGKRGTELKTYEFLTVNDFNDIKDKFETQIDNFVFNMNTKRLSF